MNVVWVLLALSPWGAIVVEVFPVEDTVACIQRARTLTALTERADKRPTEYRCELSTWR